MEKCLTLDWFCIIYLQVVTDILHLHGQNLTAYKGDYDTFERTREEQLKNQQKAFDTSEKARAHMQVQNFLFLFGIALILVTFFLLLYLFYVIEN